MSIESGRVNFTVFYNIHYNVSIHTASLCGEYNALWNYNIIIMVSVIKIKHGNYPKITVLSFTHEIKELVCVWGSAG